jgi:hypothetical protein
VEYRTDVVENTYEKFLNRAADPTGLATWVAFLAAGGTREQLEADFLGSPEFLTRHGATANGFLSGVYQDVLGRAVDPAGAATWGAMLANGGTPIQVALDIVDSAEAEQLAVESFYEKYLHRPADSAGLAGWLNFLETGGNEEAVLAGILGSQEDFQKQA